VKNRRALGCRSTILAKLFPPVRGRSQKGGLEPENWRGGLELISIPDLGGIKATSDKTWLIMYVRIHKKAL